MRFASFYIYVHLCVPIRSFSPPDASFLSPHKPLRHHNHGSSDGDGDGDATGTVVGVEEEQEMEQRATLTLLADRFSGLRCVRGLLMWLTMDHRIQLPLSTTTGSDRVSTNTIYRQQPQRTIIQPQWLRRRHLRGGPRAVAAAEPRRDQQPPRGAHRVHVQVSARLVGWWVGG